jgi:hypothetical protein
MLDNNASADIRNTSVDIRALRVFNDTLTSRLGEVDAMVGRLTNLAGASPKLGTFVDGITVAAGYDKLRQQYLERLGRLRTAIVAAQTATNDIIVNYTRAEASNNASSVTIGGQLGGVFVALDGGPTGA